MLHTGQHPSPWRLIAIVSLRVLYGLHVGRYVLIWTEHRCRSFLAQLHWLHDASLPDLAIFLLGALPIHVLISHLLAWRIDIAAIRVALPELILVIDHVVHWVHLDTSATIRESWILLLLIGIGWPSIDIVLSKDWTCILDVGLVQRLLLLWLVFLDAFFIKSETDCLLRFWLAFLLHLFFKF